MSVPAFLVQRQTQCPRLGLPRPEPARLLRQQMQQSGHWPHRRDLKGHFGCINAVEFSRPDGRLLASGGDDARVVVWDLQRAINHPDPPRSPAHPARYVVMQQKHNSNIFCLAFDVAERRVFSGGNDDQLLVHDLHTKCSVDIFSHDEPVNGVDAHPQQDHLLATACSDGRVQLIDLRVSGGLDSALLVAGNSSPFHAVVFNPVEPRLVATANQDEGIQLWDLRRPRTCAIHYLSSTLRPRSAMSVRFDDAGGRLLALGRHRTPLLYDLHSPYVRHEFDHDGYYNSCTMKSCSFAGVNDEYVMSGSDDFNLYCWKIPADPTNTLISQAQHVLTGHRSIVNHVRFNQQMGIIASSGVEKVIKIWSVFPLPGAERHIESEIGAVASEPRAIFSRQDYVNLVLQSDTVLSHDYSSESTEENLRMLAFFDSLIQRELERSQSSNDDDDEKGNEHDRLSEVTSSEDSEEDNRNLIEIAHSSTTAPSQPENRLTRLISKKRRLNRRKQERLIRLGKKPKLDPNRTRLAMEHAKTVIRLSPSSTEEGEGVSTSDDDISGASVDGDPTTATDTNCQKSLPELFSNDHASHSSSGGDDEANRLSPAALADQPNAEAGEFELLRSVGDEHENQRMHRQILLALQTSDDPGPSTSSGPSSSSSVDTRLQPSNGSVSRLRAATSFTKPSAKGYRHRNYRRRKKEDEDD